MRHDITRLVLQLDILEREPQLDDARAVALLRSEFALALNAGYFTRLSAGDIGVEVDSRSRPQEGVGRFHLALELVERTPAMTDEQAAELVRREFRHALNGAQFWRICSDDFRVTLVAREPVDEPAIARVR